MVTEHGLRWRVVIAFGAFIALLSALLTKRWVDAGNFPSRVPWLTLGLLVVMCGLVLWFGAAVRQYTRGRKGGLDPIRAARTLALAQAAALTGAAVAGFYLGQLIAIFPDRDLMTVQSLMWRIGLGALAGAAFLASGMVAQSWCRIPPRGEEKEPRDRDRRDRDRDRT